MQLDIKHPELEQLVKDMQSKSEPLIKCEICDIPTHKYSMCLIDTHNICYECYDNDRPELAKFGIVKNVL
jgi:hypothetical protein